MTSGPPIGIRVVACLIAVLLGVGPTPLGLRVALAQETPKATVAVLGVHGNGSQEENLLRALHREIVLALSDSGRFDVLTGEPLRERLEARRDDILGETFLGPARRAFEEGRVLYNQARPDEAVDAFDRAAEAMDAGREFLRDARLAVDIALYRGLAFETRGDVKAAHRAFTEVARRAPDHVLDTLEFPPSTVELFDRARAEVLATTGPLAVDLDEASTGTGPARIRLDGRLVGEAPTTLDGVPAGDHGLVVERDGGHRWFASVRVPEGGGSAEVARLGQRGLSRRGETMGSDRSGATRRLYRSLAEAAAVDLVVMAGFDMSGDFRVALHCRGSGTFSLSLIASLAASPGAQAAFVRQLVERVSLYAGKDGLIVREKVDAKVIPLLLGGNPVLNDYLFVVPKEEPVVATTPTAPVEETRRAPPPGVIVAIVLGILGGVGAGAGAALATNPPGGPSGTVTITFP